MPDNIFGGQGATLLTAIVIVAVAMLALVGVFWLIRARASSTFIRGGKNRLPRLAVLDATAVDTRRRLVLIRRDDVEHLVMIGGPTDIVIESRITGHADPAAAAPQAERMVQPAAAQQPRPPAPAQAPQPPQPRPATAAIAAAAGAASTMHSQAADALDSVRTRVFEDPGFDESELEELMAAPPAPQPVTASPARTPAAQAQPSTSAADAERTEAADLLESARTRVFEEPSFDDSAFDDLTADESPNRAATQPSVPPSARPVTAAKSPAPDFEAVLAEELSEDLSVDIDDESFFTEPYTEHQLDPSEAEIIEAPKVKPEPQPSRDSLEAEMERLLGDLSRKP